MHQLRRLRARVPEQAISAGEERYVIDHAKCTECVGHFDTQQCAAVCPVDACVKDPERKESQEELMAKFHKLSGK